MAEPLDAPLDRSEPLGIKNPLLPPRALGQTEPNLQFMLPLGARPLAVLDPSIFFPEAGSEYAEIGQSFAESPFFDNPGLTSQIDHQSGSTATAFSQNTQIQRQTVSLDSPPPLPLENQLIRVQEQQAQVQETDASEPTEVLGASVDLPILPGESIANEPVSSEIAPTADLEASIQRSQLSLGEEPLLAQTASEQTSLSGTEPSNPTPTLPDSTTDSPIPSSDFRSTADTTIQPRLVSSQSEGVASSSAQSPSVEASTGTTAPVTEALQEPSGLGEAFAISTESPEDTQTFQPDVTSSVSESAIAATIQRQAIPEQPQRDEYKEVEAIPVQASLSQEAESSTLRQATEGAMPLSESPHNQQPSQPPIQNITELESATSLLSSDAQLQETPQSIAPIIQTSLTSPSPLEQAAQPDVPESSTTEPRSEALTELPKQATAAKVSPSNSNPIETTDNSTLVEPVEDVPTTSPELTTSTEQKTIQPRFESASPQSETTSVPLLDLPSEVATAESHQTVELSSPETVQRTAESVQENPAISQPSPTTGDEVQKVRSHSPLEPPLPSPAPSSDAVLPTTANPDSSPSGLELATSAPTQNPSPPARIPIAETEAIVQPKLDSTSATPASATELDSLLDTSEVMVKKSPQIEIPAPESLEIDAPTYLEASEPSPTLQRSPAVSEPIPTEAEISGQEIAEQAIAPNLASPATSNPPLLASEPTLDNQETTISNNEQATVTEALTIQPLLESTTVQHQVTDAPVLEQPASSPQSIIQAKEADFTDLQTAPEISQEPSSQSSALGEATVLREREDAIAPTTDSSSATPPIFPFTIEETPTSVLHTQPADGLTATEPDLIQPFQQTAATHLNELPTLPTVLQDLSVLDPLGSTPLIQTASLADIASPTEPVPVIAKKHSNVFDNADGVEQFPISLPPQSILQTAPISSNTEVVADVPSEWSSIAELLSGNSFSVPSPSAQASPSFPDLQPFRPTETVIQPQFESATRRTSADTVTTIQADEDRSNVTEVTSETEAAADASPEKLEKLAREIYGLVRQRFKIEQERSGNSYSGRLPW
jgi:hypothetical protein